MRAELLPIGLTFVDEYAHAAAISTLPDEAEALEASDDEDESALAAGLDAFDPEAPWPFWDAHPDNANPAPDSAIAAPPARNERRVNVECVPAIMYPFAV